VLLTISARANVGSVSPSSGAECTASGGKRVSIVAGLTTFEDTKPATSARACDSSVAPSSGSECTTSGVENVSVAAGLVSFEGTTLCNKPARH
jgi:hypothetical protein